MLFRWRLLWWRGAGIWGEKGYGYEENYMVEVVLAEQERVRDSDHSSGKGRDGGEERGKARDRHDQGADHGFLIMGTGK